MGGSWAHWRVYPSMTRTCSAYGRRWCARGIVYPYSPHPQPTTMRPCQLFGVSWYSILFFRRHSSLLYVRYVHTAVSVLSFASPGPGVGIGVSSYNCCCLHGLVPLHRSRLLRCQASDGVADVPVYIPGMIRTAVPVFIALCITFYSSWSWFHRYFIPGTDTALVSYRQ